MRREVVLLESRDALDSAADRDLMTALRLVRELGRAHEMMVGAVARAQARDDRSDVATIATELDAATRMAVTAMSGIARVSASLERIACCHGYLDDAERVSDIADRRYG